MPTDVKIFSGTGSKAVAEKVAENYGTTLGNVKVERFSDDEFQPSFEETVRGSHVYLIQSTFAPSDNLFELLMMVDAAKRASAGRVVAILPYFGYARQDRKDKPRVAIGSKLVADLLTSAGVDRLITMDLHADQIQGFFEVPVDHLFASSIFIPYIESLGLDNAVVAAPDVGGTKRANAYAKHLNMELAICYKQRKKANEIEKMTVIGDVKDRDVLIVDDIIDTAGTLTRAADMMMEQGARSVRAFCSHPVLSGDAFNKIENSSLSELIVTDSIPLEKESEKIRVLTVAGLFADVITRVEQYRSISSNFVIA